MSTLEIVPGAVIDEHKPVRTAAQRLRNTLRLNATTSGLGGLVAVIAGGPINRLLGTSSPGWVRLAGLGLVVFALDVAALAGSSIRRLNRFTPVVIAGDATWVVASIATIAAGWYSTRGGIVIAGVAAMVATFCVRQFVLTRRLGRLTRTAKAEVLDENPPTEVVAVQTGIEATPATAWAIATDHELFGRLAPNLSSVTPTGPNSAELSRSCVNRKGQTWHEECTLWREGERFDVNVDTTNYPYPIAEMRGSWWTHNATPTTVGMDYHYRPLPGLYGRIFAAAMQAAFPFVLRRITRGWKAEARRRHAVMAAAPSRVH
jgi:Polyketide cyclase / dehydrase and lipid transport